MNRTLVGSVLLVLGVCFLALQDIGVAFAGPNDTYSCYVSGACENGTAVSAVVEGTNTDCEDGFLVLDDACQNAGGLKDGIGDGLMCDCDCQTC